MSDKCVRKLTVRWSLLIIALSAVVVFAVNAIFQPDYSTLKYNVDDVIELSFVSPKYLDAIVALFGIMGFVLYLLYVADNDKRPLRDSKLSVTKQKDLFANFILFGVCMGIAGTILIAIAGVVVVPWATAICSLLIVAWHSGGLDDHTPVAPSFAFVQELATVYTMWVFCTMFMGLLAGAGIAAVALVVAALTHFGTYWLFVLSYRFFKGPFYRTMIACEPDCK